MQIKKLQFFFIIMLSFLLIFIQVASASYYDEGNTGLTETSAFIIDSRTDFMEFRDRINSGNDPQGAYYKLNISSKTVSLAKDYTDWEPIGTEKNPFTGHLDGNGHTVKINVERKGKNAALFGTIKTQNSSYAVKNLTVNGTVNGYYVAGIVINLYNGLIEDCTFTGNLVAWSNVSMWEWDNLPHGYVGGIVEHMFSGMIKNCIVKEASIEINPSYYNRNAYAGGIVSRMEGGTIENCSVTEDSQIIGTSEKSVGMYGFGRITAGGIVGVLISGTVTDNKALAVISLNTRNMYSGGIIGEIQDEDFYLENNQYSNNGYGIGCDLDGEATDFPGCVRIGSGTEDDPVIIDSISAFTELKQNINSKVILTGDTHYKLTTDLIITDWEPIGTDSNPFTGHFDGNGHTITINVKGFTGSSKSLFGTIKTENRYAIKNLTVNGNISGRFIGGFVLNLYSGSIENCTFTGNLSATTVTDADRNSFDTYAAGIAEIMHGGTIKNCTIKAATIFSQPQYYPSAVGFCGGIVASMDGGIIENCVISEDVVIQCFSQQQIAADGFYSFAKIEAGGIVGALSNGTIRNNEAYGEVHGWAANGTVNVGTVIGEIVGSMSRITVNNNKYACNGESKDVGFVIYSLMARYGIGYNAGGSGTATDNPGCIFIGAGSSEDNPYIIDSASALSNLSRKVNSGTNIENFYYKLTENISLGTWTSIGTSYPFTGHFDGNNHTITMNINKNPNTTVALFGNISTENGYAVKNLNVKGTIKAQSVAGVTINLLNGVIENCTFSGTLVAYAPFEYVDETPAAVRTTYAAGIAAVISGGIIKDCTIKTSNIISNPYFVGASGYVGGIAAGMSGGKIENCFVNDDVIISCISQYQIQALVTGNYASVNAGGIVGDFQGGTIKDNETYAEVHGWSISATSIGGVIGQISEKAASTFTIENNKYSNFAEYMALDDENDIKNPCLYLPIEDVSNMIISATQRYRIAPDGYGSAYPYTDVAKFGIGRNFKSEGVGTDTPGCINISPGYGTTEDNPRFIDSFAALDRVRIRVNMGIDSTNSYYKLSNDILVTDTKWEPIGTEDNPFTGHFDGNGHSIELHVERSGYSIAGLFGVIKTESNKYAVKNLTVKGNLEGHFVAGVATNLYNGSIENCIFEGTIIAHDVHFSWEVTEMDNNAYAGGIVEHMHSGVIKNCTVKNSSITSKPYNWSGAIGYVGGIVSRMDGGIVENCVVTDDSIVMGVPSDVTYLTSGSDYPTINAGGIVGFITNGTIKNNNSYATVQGLGGTLHLGGIIGKIEKILSVTITIENNSFSCDGKTVSIGDFKTILAEYGIGFDSNGNASNSPGCANLYEEEEVKPEFTVHSLLLSGQIGVKFYTALHEDQGLNYTPENCWMEFDINGDNNSNPPQLFDWETFDSSTGYHHFICYINSVQMADPITATLYYGNNKTVTHNYSVLEYLDTAIERSKSAAMRELASAIKDYGYYMQVYLARYNNWKLGEKHFAMEPAYDYNDDDIAETKNIVSNYAIIRDTGQSEIAKVTFTLTLDSNTTINLFLEPKSSYTGSVSATFEGSNENLAVKMSNGTYKVEISGISAHKLGDTYTVTVNAGEEFDVKVSALSYVNAVLNSSSAAYDLKQAVTSLYRYYATSMAYRNSIIPD